MIDKDRLTLQREDEEDAYYTTKEIVETELGIKIDIHQWNSIFSKIVSPYRAEIYTLVRERDTVYNAIRTIKDAVDG